MNKVSPMDVAKSVLGGGAKPKGKRHVTKMEIRRAKGGYIARHTGHADDGKESGYMGSSESPEHILASMKELNAHISKHMPEEMAEAKDGKEEAE